MTSIATKSPARRFVQRDIARADRHRATVRHRVAGIDNEVEQRGLELGDVGLDRPCVGANVEGEAHGTAHAGVEHLADGRDAFGEIDRLRVDALPPRKGEELVRQRGAAFGGGFDRGHGALELGVARSALLQDVKAAADDHQKIVEVVGNPAGELSERIEFLRLGELLLHCLELELGVAALGDVARDLGEADQRAALVDRVDHHAGPEERAVLSDAPAFLLISALFPGNTERPRRLAIGAVGLGVEAGKMLAEDFLGRIALDAFAADVPAGDDPLGIKHVEGVVGDSLNQQPETALALEQVSLLTELFGHSGPRLDGDKRRTWRISSHSVGNF